MKSFILLCLSVVSAHATWTLVQDPTTSAACALATCSLTLNQATGAGHVIVVAESFEKATGVTISSVSGGGSYTIPAGCAVFSATQGFGVNCAYTLASTSGATSISVTTSSAPLDSEFTVREYSFTGSVSIDNTGTRTDTTCVTTCNGVTLVLTGTNDVIVQEGAVITVTSVNTPYTHFTTDAVGAGYADLLNTVSGTAPVWNSTGTGIMAGAIAIKETGAAVETMAWSRRAVFDDILFLFSWQPEVVFALICRWRVLVRLARRIDAILFAAILITLYWFSHDRRLIYALRGGQRCLDNTKRGFPTLPYPPFRT